MIINTEKWWDVKVSYIHADEQAKTKTARILVHGISLTDVETKITNLFNEKGDLMEFGCAGAASTKIIEIIGEPTFEEGEVYYDVVIEFEEETELASGEVKVKKRNEKYIIIAKSVHEAESIALDRMSDSVETHRVKDVKTTGFSEHI